MQELEVFYNNELKPIINSLNSKRAKIRSKLVTYIIFPAAILILIAFFYSISISDFTSLIVVLVIAVLAYAIFYKKITFPYKVSFKKNVITELVNFVEENLDYNHNRYVSEAEFKMSRLYEHRIDDYKGEDCISGMVGKTNIKFSEIKARYKTRQRTKNGTRTQWHTLFEGLFFTADFNKHFKSELILKPDVAVRFLGRLGHKVQKLQDINIFRNGKLIIMENNDFDKAFKVVGTDETEARYILTPSLMEKILKLNEEIKLKEKTSISMSFINSKVYMALPLRKNLFEPRIFASEVVSREDIIEFYDYIKLMVDIVEDLDLNTRIWTKK